MFYNSSILSDSSLKLVYKLLNRVDRKQDSTNEECVRTMVNCQVALSPKNLILIIEKYLMNVMEEID